MKKTEEKEEESDESISPIRRSASPKRSSTNSK